MSKLSQDKVFQPIDDLFEEMMSELAANINYNSDISEATVKIALMKAYQRGREETLDKVQRWL